MGNPGARGLILLVVAVLLGIYLLQKFDTGSSFNVPVQSGAPSATTKATTTTTRKLPTVSVLPTVTTKAVRSPDQVKVLPANGTSTQGLGGRTGDYLHTLGYNNLAATDASKTVDATMVEHKADFDAEARALAVSLQLPASSVRVLDDNVPVSDTRNADIVLVIGPDLHLPGDTTSTTKK